MNKIHHWSNSVLTLKETFLILLTHKFSLTLCKNKINFHLNLGLDIKTDHSTLSLVDIERSINSTARLS